MASAAYPELSNREQELLQYIIQNFIVSANPVASKTLVDRYKLNVSSATVRSTMNSLENKGLLDHPHTSAGRIPTELGYRFYVNSLMEVSTLSLAEEKTLDHLNTIIQNDFDDAVVGAARTLARLSNLLAVVIAPKLANGIFKKIELVNLGGNRMLVIITIESGLVKTLNIEVEADLDTSNLDNIARILNERLSGYSLQEISGKIHEMLSDDYSKDSTGLIRVFIDSADTIFEDHRHKNFHFGGVEYMAMQPEFNDLTSYRSIIELIENEDLIVHIMDRDSDQKISDGFDKEVMIRIGSENKIQQIERCSVVSANYSIGSVSGTIGLVGPTRMDYPRMVTLVEQLANRFTKNSFYE